MTTTQTAEAHTHILHNIANLSAPGQVHRAHCASRGFVALCGRTIRYGVGTPADVNCEACLAAGGCRCAACGR